MSRLHTTAWALGAAGGALVFLAIIAYDVRRDAGLAGLTGLLGLLLLSQGWRLGRLDRRLRQGPQDS